MRRATGSPHGERHSRTDNNESAILVVACNAQLRFILRGSARINSSELFLEATTRTDADRVAMGQVEGLPLKQR